MSPGRCLCLYVHEHVVLTSCTVQTPPFFMRIHDLLQRKHLTNYQRVCFLSYKSCIYLFLFAKELMANTSQIRFFFLSTVTLCIIFFSKSCCKVKTRCLNSRKTLGFGLARAHQSSMTTITAARPQLLKELCDLYVSIL